MIQTVTTDDVVQAARATVGWPYRHMGHDMHGIDCIGVVRWVARHLGIFDVPVQAYSEQPDPRFLIEQVSRYLVKFGSSRDAKPGRILMFKLTRDGPPQHFGIMTSPSSFVHALRERRKVLEVSYSRFWRQLLCGVWSFKGVA